MVEPANRWTEPPVPDVPLPADRLTRPLQPPVAEPEPIRITPLLPISALPELKTSFPLAPDTPVFALVILIIPVLVAVPSPVPQHKSPPVFLVLRAAASIILPPSPDVPLPVDIRMRPA